LAERKCHQCRYRNRHATIRWEGATNHRYVQKGSRQVGCMLSPPGETTLVAWGQVGRTVTFTRGDGEQAGGIVESSICGSGSMRRGRRQVPRIP
jgi:hypothetical protein